MGQQPATRTFRPIRQGLGWPRPASGWLVLITAALALAIVGSRYPGQAQAQDEAAAEVAEQLGAQAEPAPAPAPAPAAQAPPASGPASETENGPPMTYLEWVWKALGLGYTLVFLSLSFTLVALFVMNVLTARRENVCPVELVEQFEASLNEKRFQEAYELAKSDESFLGQVLSAGLAKLSVGYQQSIEAMQEVGEEENMKLDHRLSYMALIGTISPMIGLFGTVHGMINSFQHIAAGQGTPRAEVLAEGISTALFTTLIGLAIAIPAIAAYNILKNRVDRLVLEVGILSESLMSRFDPQKK